LWIVVQRDIVQQTVLQMHKKFIDVKNVPEIFLKTFKTFYKKL